MAANVTKSESTMTMTSISVVHLPLSSFLLLLLEHFLICLSSPSSLLSYPFRILLLTPSRNFEDTVNFHSLSLFAHHFLSQFTLFCSLRVQVALSSLVIGQRRSRARHEKSPFLHLLVSWSLPVEWEGWDESSLGFREEFSLESEPKPNRGEEQIESSWFQLISRGH